MHYLIGFLIALFIALTGVGAGTITVPLLILLLGVPATQAVGIGLTFSAAVKLLLVPAQIARGHVHWRTLGWMLLGGLPGVILGSLLLKRLVSWNVQNGIDGILGIILLSTAVWQLCATLRARARIRPVADRARWLAWLMFPVGIEVGFSSAGAGALGSAALLCLTPLEPAQVVGTDIAFGFFVSLAGSGLHILSLPLQQTLLMQLTLGGVAGAASGTLLSAWVPRQPLRIVLWSWLLVLGGQMLFTSVHAPAAPSAALHKEARN